MPVLAKGERGRLNRSVERFPAQADELRPAPPHNLEAEQALLGAILVNNEALGRVSDFLRPERFYDPLHQLIYETAAKLIATGKRADPITLKTYFEGAEPIDANLTVPQYLGRLAANAATIINARDYGRTICDLATRRQLILISEDMAKTAFESPVDFDPAEQMAEAATRLDCLANIASPGSVGTLLSAASLAGQLVPPREWHVPDLLPANTATLLFGDGGTGKSLLALQLAVSTALGRSWLEQPVRRGPVLYVGAEDDRDEMHRRLAAICKAGEIEFDRLENLHLLCLAGSDAVLATANDSNVVQPTPLWRKVCRLVRAIKPLLVIYDTLADLFAGNENNRAQARQFVALLSGQAIETRSAALLLAHPSLSGMASGSGTSGSTAWSNSVRSRLYLARVREGDSEVDPDARVLRTMKANYAAKGGEISMRWHQGIFAVGERSGADVVLSTRQMRADAVFLELLKTYADQGRFVGASPSPTYAPAVFVRDPKAAGIAKKDLEGAMNRLLEAGRIRLRLSQDGPPSRRRNVLEVAL